MLNRAASGPHRRPWPYGPALPDFAASPTWTELASALPDCEEIYLPEHNHFIPMQDPELGRSNSRDRHGGYSERRGLGRMVPNKIIRYCVDDYTDRLTAVYLFGFACLPVPQLYHAFLGRSLAHDLRGRGISVAILHPGFVRTDMTGHQGLIDPPESASGLIDRIDEHHSRSQSGDRDVQDLLAGLAGVPIHSYGAAGASSSFASLRWRRIISQCSMDSRWPLATQPSWRKIRRGVIDSRRSSSPGTSARGVPPPAGKHSIR